MTDLPPGARIGGPDSDAVARDDAAASPLGGRVERTGIGLLRRGEIVVADEPSAARLIGARPGVGPAVTIEIPIVIEIGPSVQQVTELAADLALRRLREALQARTVG